MCSQCHSQAAIVDIKAYAEELATSQFPKVIEVASSLDAPFVHNSSLALCVCFVAAATCRPLCNLRPLPWSPTLPIFCE